MSYVLVSTLKFCGVFFSSDNVGGEQSTLIEPVISPIILDVWAQHIADPFISIDAVEVLEVCFCQNWKVQVLDIYYKTTMYRILFDCIREPTRRRIIR